MSFSNKQYHLVNIQIAIENGPVEIVDIPIKNMDLSIVFCEFTRPGSYCLGVWQPHVGAKSTKKFQTKPRALTKAAAPPACTTYLGDFLPGATPSGKFQGVTLVANTWTGSDRTSQPYFETHTHTSVQ